MDIKVLESKLSELEELKDKAFKMERELVKELYQLEKDTFGGLTYMEFVNKQKREILVNDKITITINQYSIYGIYQINEDVILTINPTIYAGDTITRPRVIYKNRETNDLPKKYQKEYDELVTECFKYKVENPSKKYQEQYKINMY